MIALVTKDIHALANPQRALGSLRFFKTGKGEYGEGDIFLGLTVPQIRVLAKKYRDLPRKDCTTLLHSKIHEERMIALYIMVYQFTKGSDEKKKDIFDLYVSNTKYINNWDLVDTSAPQIVGMYLLDYSPNSSRLRSNNNREILYKLARSQNLWERRIAILATMAFVVKAKEYQDTFTISEILLHDRHDLIHKAVGWLLREVGKRVSREVEEEFLKKHYQEMPRTMLRYAIEHFPEERRKEYLQGNI